MAKSTRVFISYAHEPENSAHGERVLALADRLRDDGLDARIDQYVTVPEKGWTLWMEDEIEAADFVLMVATETYERRRRGQGEPDEGRGVRWEGAIISQALYDRKLVNTKFIPVLFDSEDRCHVPPFLHDFPVYRVEDEEGYDALYRRLTGQPEVEAPPVGRVRKRPRRNRGVLKGDQPQVAVAKLPATGPTFVAREGELARLDAAWEEGLNVLTFVAMGGAGKSALVNRWLDRMQEDGWRGAERVLGWSFYSQGTDSAGASSEAFSDYALDWLGYRGDPITSPWRRGQVLAGLVRERRTLLVLDGLEPLQHPPGAQKGRIQDRTVQALVKELAADNPGLCVVTTRLGVTDVAGRAGTDSVDLERLPPEAGAELLGQLGVEGEEAELRAASRELGGHGLALTLLGTYLRDLCGGDIRRRGEVAVLDRTAEIEGSEHARNVMAAYETWFGEGPELRVLRLLGLFDRPADPAALTALRGEPEIPGLTEGIGAGDERAWQAALARLRQARLVAPASRVKPVTREPLDAHPLVREYFAQRLREIAQEAWILANQRLYDHYRQAAPEFPETLQEMLPLYAAMVHGCQAGQEQEVCLEVYKRRVCRNTEFFGAFRLGAFGVELTAVRALFAQPWAQPSDQLDAEDRAWLLGVAGYYLIALGRLPEAVEPLRVSTDIDVEAGRFKAASISAGNLSEVTLALGDVRGAVSAGEESVELADKSGDAFHMLTKRSTLAHAMHQAGRLSESRLLFERAEALQAGLQPDYPRLYSLRGYQYCDLLLSLGEPAGGSGLEGSGESYFAACKEVQQRAEEILSWSEMPRWERSYGSLHEIGLNRLALGRALHGLVLGSGKGQSNLSSAAGHLEAATDLLREAGREDYLPGALLARAALRRLAGDLDGAAADLREAQEIAERGSMRLFEADAHLEWTRLHLDLGDREAARRHLHRARELVRECGYGRREREVAWLEGRLAEGS